MKKKFAFLLAVVIALAAILSVGAAPGDANDPLVSRSYVDDRFNQLLTVLSALGDFQPPVITHPNENASEANVSYVPVSVPMGQMLIGGEGTEIILRSGKAIGYCTGENGMVNITTGTEIFNNIEISPNHMLIVPRDDGRGALVIEDAWFLVKGSYSIK